ncbi:chemotaxis protein CheD [Spirochaeta cellobiosiphila]|uniref:chemotaxis protein CheD n=1 Tax=Spirochaeta cellobiosiphila TaxID=504483 RepID=UPI00040A72AF|nr:hypothetical protein [Spirochaeta cellobiosiphila]
MYRKYNAQLKANVLTIFAGETYVSSKQEILCTVLGSCVSVCLYDPVSKVGGMNHFMLPEDKSSSLKNEALAGESLVEKSMRYGITAMEVLIADMQKNGANRNTLRAKIFGGGNVISRNAQTESVGDKNIGFARAFLKSELIAIDSEDVGKDFGRKIFFLTGENSVFVRKVGLDQAVAEEQNYMKKLREIKRSNENVTLF